ncbi:NlpC/P60 family protein [Actinomadura citrea]|uniref:C40 family peptidase n=1 Tax=Actinomadura citrea TaxID=46158 RepID=UPI002E2B733A|nr:NlpC/P60 family protein [Actinomadura citrea]
MVTFGLGKFILRTGCLGVVAILVLMVAVMFIAIQNVASLGITNVCGPANPDGPELLSPAPKPSPGTGGPTVAPAAYERGPDGGPLGSGAVQNVAAAARAPANSIPENYVKLYKTAGPKYDIPWYVLAGIGKVETDHGRSTLPGVHSGANYAGAGGPMQFLQSTFNAYAVDGDKNGQKDRYNPADAIFSAANYLHASGAPAQTRKAIFAYNHSWDYVNLVLSWAERYAGGKFALGGANNAGMSCASFGGGAPSALGKSIISHAKRWLKTPYVWGGGNINGPTGGGFDCSGLTLYAVYQATGGKIQLAHYTGDQLRDSRGTKVSRSNLQPGDLVFFTKPGDADPHHVGIYVGGNQMLHAPYTGTVVKIGPMDEKEFSGGVRFTAPKTVKA